MTESSRSVAGDLWQTASTLWRVVPIPVLLTIAVVTVAVGQLVVPRLGLGEFLDTVVRFVGSIVLFFALLWATYVVAARRR
ncbi:hypothetical protein ACKVMT_12570 [Halobacteriales archaeon Cl-PHB]